MEDKMKIDISSLIGDLVEATVKSLNEAPKDPDIDPDTKVTYTTARTQQKRTTTYQKSPHSL